MKRMILALLIVLVPLRGMTATLPAYSPKFGNAMAGIVAEKVASEGFASNDPRFVATESAIGTALTGVASGLAVAAGLPLWATIAIGAVAAGAVALGIGALTQWYFNSDGTVTSGSSLSGSMSLGGPYWGCSGGGVFVESASSSSACAEALLLANAAYPQYAPETLGAEYAGYPTATQDLFYVEANGNPQAGNIGSTYFSSGASATCASGQVYTTSCIAAPSTGASAPVAQSISDAVASVPDSDMTLPANPALVAQAVNNAWQAAAAQPNYPGLPFSNSNPVTVADVQAFQSSNPSAYPSVGDMLAPAVDPSTSAVAQPVAPGTVASPGINAAPAGSAQVNLGADPGIGAPNLEATPTAQMILSPILNLFPDLKSFVVPSHSSECPKPTMTLFGKTLVLDEHCTLLEAVRPTLYAVMAFVWSVIGLFIILAA